MTGDPRRVWSNSNGSPGGIWASESGGNWFGCLGASWSGAIGGSEGGLLGPNGCSEWNWFNPNGSWGGGGFSPANPTQTITEEGSGPAYPTKAETGEGFDQLHRQSGREFVRHKRQSGRDLVRRSRKKLFCQTTVREEVQTGIETWSKSYRWLIP